MLAVCACFATSCSTTSHLPEGEQLYTGIREIRYNEDFSSDTSRMANLDNSGVITSVANAVRAVDAALDGRTYNWSDALSLDSLTKEQRRELRQRIAKEKEEFATAQEEVDAVLAYPPNGSLMGSSTLRSPINIGLWFYNGLVNDSSKVGRWFFNAFAKQPVLISTVAPETRAKVATNTLHNYGYFQGEVDYRIHTLRNPRKARVSYRVLTGPLYRFDSIAYLDFTPDVSRIITHSRQKPYVVKGEGFSALALTNERTRISDLLRNRGYYYYSPSYVTFLADTFQRQNFVQLQVRPADNMPDYANRPWYIGRLHVDIRNSAGASLTQSRTMWDGSRPPRPRKRRKNKSSQTVSVDGDTLQIARANQITFMPTTFQWDGDDRRMPLRPYMWRDAVFFERGQRYSLFLENRTLSKLNEMGVFSQIDMQFVPADTLPTCDTLDIYISAVLDKPYDSSLELDATLKSNSQLGPALTYTLSKRNAFRGGETVSFKIFGSYEWQLGTGGQKSNSLLNSYDFGTSLSFEFPRFVVPFVNRRKLRFPATTTFALEADWLNRSGFYQVLTYSLNANYTWKPMGALNRDGTRSNRRARNTVTHNVDVRLDFHKRLSSTQEFEDILAANPVLEVSMRNYFVPSIGYTFTYNSSRRHRNPLYLQFSVKEAGNLVASSYAVFGKPFREQDKTLFDNPFAQFVKLTGEIHRTQTLHGGMQLVGRFFAGAIFSYGNMLSAPYSEQFYVGGANSVRAFTVRSIGPGRFRSNNAKYSYVDQTGDIKLEANVELRAPLVGNLSSALFIDAGNVWLARKDEARPDAEFSFSNLRHLALGTGFGLRYDLEFLVLRLDLGIGLHAPYDTGKGGFYNIPKFKDGLALHFAIGYPF